MHCPLPERLSSPTRLLKGRGTFSDFFVKNVFLRVSPFRETAWVALGRKSPPHLDAGGGGQAVGQVVRRGHLAAVLLRDRLRVPVADDHVRFRRLLQDLRNHSNVAKLLQFLRGTLHRENSKLK